MENKSWSVVYLGSKTQQTIAATVYSSTLDAALQHARADAATVGCGSLRIDSIEPFEETLARI